MFSLSVLTLEYILSIFHLYYTLRGLAYLKKWNYQNTTGAWFLYWRHYGKVGST